ncbi:MAG: hypothetical protein IJM70_02710, partial [Prevotella sp.]|nr:hypothetical protein [Prevotella sp.]
CEILTGNVPFGETGGHEQKGSDVPLPKIPNVQPDIQRLIHACLDYDPAKRPTARQIMDAARFRQYPIKSKKLLYALLSVLVVALIGCALFFLTPKNAPVEQGRPAEEVYKEALVRMNSDNVDTLKAGMAQMDSLTGVNYIPAIYEMAFTYGWYSDYVSVNRKKLLGIEMDDNYLPIRDLYSNRAVGLFSRIMELNDSAYADINANAAYRLACYYVMPNNIYKPNYEKGKTILLWSKKWATIAKDEDLLERINRGLETFE